MQLRSFHNNALIDSCLLDSAPFFLLDWDVRRRSQAVTDTADSAQSLMSVSAASQQPHCFLSPLDFTTPATA